MNISLRTAAPIAIGVLLTLAVIVFVDVPSSTRLAREIQDTAHAPAFALVAWLLVKALGTTGCASARSYVAAFAICILLAVGTEILQYVVGRDASFIDIGRDILGTTAALCIHAAGGAGFRMRRGLWLLGVVAILLAFAPLAWTTAAHIHRRNQFPVVAQFNSKLDLAYVQIRSALPPEITVVARGAERALEVPLDGGAWSGVELEEPYPDWSGFGRLRMTLTNPTAEALALTLRIHDAHHDNEYEDRLNVPIELPAHATRTFSVPTPQIENAPKGRRMDLRQIANLQIFSEQPVPGGSFLLERIWLE